ncbi:hypothetical protein GBAR_LOCUS6332 [Geodia barretti]|uniref:Uncharacterized protein n=1 Tax=Geodia barretti TaxID=519541 RepID=A0AA35RDF4_GEOBA|nr:hypothetical protein GBAR_LOCUS6332 [Geodia barretti]
MAAQQRQRKRLTRRKRSKLAPAVLLTPTKRSSKRKEKLEIILYDLLLC